MVLNVFGAVMAKLRNVTAAFPWPENYQPALAPIKTETASKTPPNSPIRVIFAPKRPKLSKTGRFFVVFGAKFAPKRLGGPCAEKFGKSVHNWS